MLPCAQQLHFSFPLFKTEGTLNTSDSSVSQRLKEKMVSRFNLDAVCDPCSERDFYVFSVAALPPAEIAEHLFLSSSSCQRKSVSVLLCV